MTIRPPWRKLFKKGASLDTDFTVSPVHDVEDDVDTTGGDGVTDHGALTGLGDDDHAQYALADGTRLRAYRGTSAPSSPSAGQLWLDTNSSPAVLKEYDGSTWQTTSPSTTAGHVIKDEGTGLTQRANLNFLGSGVTATDNSGTGATDVTIPGATGGATDLDGLSDVVISSPAARQGIFHDGTNFVNQYAPGQFVASVSKTATFTALLAERAYKVDASSGAVTANLPTAVGSGSKQFFIKKTDSSTNTVTLDPSGSETINGATTVTLSTQDEGAVIESDGANWFITSRPRGGDTTPGTYSGYRTLVTLGSDVSNSTTTYADVTGLSFAVTSGTIYRFHALIFYAAQATATGAMFAVSGPALPTIISYRSSLATGAANQNDAAAYDIPSTPTTTTNNVTGNIATIEGLIQPSTSGTLIVRFKSEAPGTNNQITAKAGSTLEYW